MSWAGFKKNVNRATTQVMMKTGHVEKTNDRDYEVEERSAVVFYHPRDLDRMTKNQISQKTELESEVQTARARLLMVDPELYGITARLKALEACIDNLNVDVDGIFNTTLTDSDISRYRTLESAATRLQKESKGYLDSLRAMTASQMRIAETIDAFYGDAGAKDGVSRSYKQAVEDLDAETIKALDGPYRTTVLEPIMKFCNYFPDINECIKKRNHKLLDYDATRAKVKKLVEKPDKDASKLPRAERESELAKTAYETLNDQLSTELPQLIDLRVPYLDPSFEALVKIQLRFCAEAYSRMAQVQQYLDADTRESYAQGRLDSNVEDVLAEMRELSISGSI